jgi:methionyl-tRNA formyltransferase
MVEETRHGCRGVKLTLEPAPLVFFGTPEFAAVHLRALLKNPTVRVALVVTQPDRPSGRGNKFTPSPVKLVAQAAGIPIWQPEKIKRNLGDSLSEIGKHGPLELGVVVAFGQILPVEVLALPRCGSINVHASLLPRWRGAAPIHRAIMAQDKKTGVCIMQMEAGLDTGPVFFSSALDISETETTGSLHDRLAISGAELLSSSAIKIINGDCQAQPQASEGVTYAEKIKGQECQINWNLPAAQVSAQIRGLSPFPGAFTMLRGKRVKIFTALADPNAQESTPGEGFFRGQDLLVGCNPGAVRIDNIQLEGKRPISAAEFQHGRKELKIEFTN